MDGKPVFSKEIIEKSIIKEMPRLDAGRHIRSESEDGIVFAQVVDEITYVYDMAIKGEG